MVIPNPGCVYVVPLPGVIQIKPFQGNLPILILLNTRLSHILIVKLLILSLAIRYASNSPAITFIELIVRIASESMVPFTISGYA